MWLADDLSRVPLTLVSKKSVRDLRRRVSGRDKEKRQRERDKEIEMSRDVEERKKQADQVELTIDWSPSKETTKNLERPPRNWRDGFKSILSLSRLPTLPPSGSCTDSFLSKPPLDMGPSSWNSFDIPISTSPMKEDEVTEKEGEHIHLGSNLSRHSSLGSNIGTNGRLVAVKMTPRKVRDAKGKRETAEEERTRIGFVREVEVLKVSWVLFFYRSLWEWDMKDAREVKSFSIISCIRVT